MTLVQPVNIQVHLWIFFCFALALNGKLLRGETKENFCITFSHSSHWHPTAQLLVLINFYSLVGATSQIYCARWLPVVPGAKFPVWCVMRTRNLS